MFKKFDLLDTDFKFTYNNESFKTNFGGIVSICLFFSLLILIWYFGQDIYLREHPEFIKKSEDSLYFPFVNISDRELFFGFKIDNFFSRPIDDPKYFELLFRYTWYKNDNETGENILVYEDYYKTKKCQPSDIISMVEYNSLRLHMYNCANYTDLNVGGEWQGSEYLGIMTYYVKRCDSETEKEFNITCATDEELVEENGSFIYINTYTQQNVVNPKNFKNPIMNILVYNYDTLNLHGQSYQRLFYSYSNMTTDTGAIFEDSETKYLLEYDRTVFGISTIDPENGVIYEVSIQTSRHMNQYSRTYIKLQGVAAIIGGFMKLALEMVGIVFSLYGKNAYKVFLYSNLLKLEIDEDVDKDKEKSYLDNKIELSKIDLKQSNSPDSLNIEDSTRQLQQSIYAKKKISKPVVKDSLPIRDYKRDSLSPNIQTKDFISNVDMVDLLKYKEKRKLKVTLTFCEQFKYTFCCFDMKNSNENHKRSRKELLILADMEISKKFNIISMLKKNDQFDLLTKTLLNKNQSFMLKNRDLRNICVNEQINEEPTHHKINFLVDSFKKKQYKTKIQELETYLIEKYKYRSFNKIDQLLLSFLDDTIKREIEIKTLV